jgi:hypothetical protein
MSNVETVLIVYDHKDMEVIKPLIKSLDDVNIPFHCIEYDGTNAEDIAEYLSITSYFVFYATDNSVCDDTNNLLVFANSFNKKIFTLRGNIEDDKSSVFSMISSTIQWTSDIDILVSSLLKIYNKETSLRTFDVKILSNEDCWIFLNDKLISECISRELKVISIPCLEHSFKFVWKKNDMVSVTIDINTSDSEKIFCIDLTSVKNYYYAKAGIKVNLFPEKLGKNQWSYKDKRNVIVLKTVYEEAGPFGVNGLARVRLLGKYGYIDTKGKIVIPIIYDYLSDYTNNGLCVARTFDSYGAFDEYGRNVIPFTNDIISIVDEVELIRIVSEDSDKIIIVNQFLEQIIDNDIEQVKVIIKNTLFSFRIGGDNYLYSVRNGMYKKTYDEILSCGTLILAYKQDTISLLRHDLSLYKVISTENVHILSSGCIVYGDESSIGIIYTDDCFETGRIFEEFQQLSDKFAIVKVNGKYGIWDLEGRKYRHMCIYDKIGSSIHNGLVAARKGNKAGFFKL